MAEHVVLLFSQCLSGHVVHVVSSLVFSLLSPAVHVSVLPHEVFLAAHDVSLDLHCPSAQVVQVVSSFAFSLSLPAFHVWPLPHDVRLGAHARMVHVRHEPVAQGGAILHRHKGAPNWPHSPSVAASHSWIPCL